MSRQREQRVTPSKEKENLKNMSRQQQEQRLLTPSPAAVRRNVGAGGSTMVGYYWLPLVALLFTTLHFALCMYLYDQYISQRIPLRTMAQKIALNPYWILTKLNSSMSLIVVVGYLGDWAGSLTQCDTAVGRSCGCYGIKILLKSNQNRSLILKAHRRWMTSP